MIAKITHAFRYINGNESTVLKIYKVVNGELVKVWPMTKLAKFDAADLLGLPVRALAADRNAHKLYLPANVVLSQKAILALADAGFTVIDAHNGPIVKLESSLADADRETLSAVMGATANLVYGLAPFAQLDDSIIPTGAVQIKPIIAEIDDGEVQSVATSCADTTARLMELLKSEARHNIPFFARNTAMQVGVEKVESEKVPAMLACGTSNILESMRSENEQIVPFLVDASHISVDATQADNRLQTPFLQNTSPENARGSHINTTTAFPMMIFTEPYFPDGAIMESEQLSELLTWAESVSLTGKLIESNQNYLPLSVALCAADTGNGEKTATDICLPASLVAEPTSSSAEKTLGESIWVIPIQTGTNYAGTDSIDAYLLPGFLAEGIPLNVDVFVDDATTSLSVGQNVMSKLVAAASQEQQQFTAFPVVVSPDYLFGASGEHYSIAPVSHWTISAMAGMKNVESKNMVLSSLLRATAIQSGTNIAESGKGNVPLMMVATRPGNGIAHDADFVLVATIGEHVQPSTAGLTLEKIANPLGSITNIVVKTAQGRDYESAKTLAGQAFLQLDCAGSELANGAWMQPLTVDSAASTSDVQRVMATDRATVAIQAKADLAAPKPMEHKQEVPIAVAVTPYFYWIGTHGEHDSVLSNTVRAEHSIISVQDTQCDRSSLMPFLISTPRLIEAQDTLLDTVNSGAAYAKWILMDALDFQMRVSTSFVAQGIVGLAGASSWRSNQMMPLEAQAETGQSDVTTLSQIASSGLGQQIEASQKRIDFVDSESAFGLYLMAEPFTMLVRSASSSVNQLLFHHIAPRLALVKSGECDSDVVGLSVYGQHRLSGGYESANRALSLSITQGQLDLLGVQGAMQFVTAGAMSGTEYNTANPECQQTCNLFVPTSAATPDRVPVFYWDVAGVLATNAKLEFEQRGIAKNRLQISASGCANTELDFADTMAPEHQIVAGGRVSIDLDTAHATNIELCSASTGLCDVRYAPYLEIYDIDTAHMSTLDILSLSEVDTLPVQLLEPTKEDWRRYKIPNYIYS